MDRILNQTERWSCQRLQRLMQWHWAQMPVHCRQRQRQKRLGCGIDGGWISEPITAALEEIINRFTDRLDVIRKTDVQCSGQQIDLGFGGGGRLQSIAAHLYLTGLNQR